jgi:hypothetical protein
MLKYRYKYLIIKYKKVSQQTLNKLHYQCRDFGELSFSVRYVGLVN